MLQMNSDYHTRLALLPGADSYFGIPEKYDWEKVPFNTCLAACYRLEKAGKTIQISLAPNQLITLELPEALAEPYRSGPGDALAEAVFVIPQRGILCRTTEGWSLHDVKGKPVKWFSTIGIQNGWWTHPVYENDAFQVYYQIGPGGSFYKLDIESGLLKKQKRE